jgi:hypothetical protein
MLSICTRLIDWNFAFKNVLPTWVKCPKELCDEIIILDWGNGKESVKDIIDQYSDPRVKLMIGQDNIIFNCGMGRNIVIREAKNDQIFFVDSDVKILNYDFLQIKKINLCKDVRLLGK